VIVALDHGLIFDVLPDFAPARQIIEKVIAGGADAVMTTYGLAKKYESLLSEVGLIIRIDGGNTELTEIKGGDLLYTVEDCLKLGADGIVCMGFPGAQEEKRTLKNISQLVSRCQDWNIPLITEMLPAGFSQEMEFNNKNIGASVRMGGELGADVIKTAYTGDKEGFADIIAGSLAPVIILGGSKSDSPQAVLEEVAAAMEAGASGVAMGRNVWKSDHPDKMTAALVDIIHHEKELEEVLNSTVILNN